jgi:hypothetical protein
MILQRTRNPEGIAMDNGVFSAQQHTFIVRIWWEAGLTGPGGRPFWRGRVQHLPTNRTLAFQRLDDLDRFIQAHTGDLEEIKPAGQPKRTGVVQP